MRKLTAVPSKTKSEKKAITRIFLVQNMTFRQGLTLLLHDLHPDDYLLAVDLITNKTYIHDHAHTITSVKEITDISVLRIMQNCNCKLESWI